VLHLAVIGSGAIFLGLNPSYTVPELERVYALTRPKGVFVEPALGAGVLAAVKGLVDDSLMVYAFDVSRGMGLSAAVALSSLELQLELGLPSWTTLLEFGEREWVMGKDPLKTVVQYASTSGTSGLPKVALLTHEYHVSQAQILFDLREANTADEMGGENVVRGAGLTALPPFHAFATPILPSSIRANRPLYIFPRYPGREPFLEAIEIFGVGEVWVPPSVLVDLASFPSGPSAPLPLLSFFFFFFFFFFFLLFYLASPFCSAIIIIVVVVSISTDLGRRL